MALLNFYWLMNDFNQSVLEQRFVYFLATVRQSITLTARFLLCVDVFPV